MIRKSTVIKICFIAFILIAAMIIIPIICQSDGSRYSRNVDGDHFYLEMERLNCTIEESFFLNEGDTIDVSIVRVSGEIKISIGQEAREPIYKGKNPEPNSFRVTVPNDGSYRFSVSGKRAEGNVSFQINRSAE